MRAGFTFNLADSADILIYDPDDLVINVKDAPYYAKGDGVTDDGAAITAAITATTTGTVYFPKGTYAYATSPNFAKIGVSIIADRGTIFKHTGTGNAFILDGGTGAATIYGLRYENLTVQGNVNSTNGIYVRNVHHAIFTHPWILGASTTGAGIRVEFCVANQWNTPRVSTNENTEHALSPVPLYGMYLTKRTSDNQFTTAQTIVNPIFEGLTNSGGAGLYFDSTQFNRVIGGTSESNYDGIFISSAASRNTFIGIDLESNTFRDLDINGTYNSFIDLNSTGTVIVANGSNRFMQGIYTNMTINVGPISNVILDGAQITTLTDNNTGQTIYRSAIAAGVGLFADTFPNQPLFTRPLKSVVSANPVSIDTLTSDVFVLTWDASFIGVAVTINAPINAVADGQKLTITSKNTTGGALGTLTFNAAYKLGAAWVQPANGFSRSITFYRSGSNWIEYSRTAADVSN